MDLGACYVTAISPNKNGLTTIVSTANDYYRCQSENGNDSAELTRQISNIRLGLEFAIITYLY